MTPEKLGRYEILDELGKGAMGVVYLARDPLIGRQLALKTFRLGYSAGDQELEQFRVRFLREAQSAGILSHPNIVTIHDVAVDPGGDFFIAMEYVQGTDLKLLMQRQGSIDVRAAVELVAQIADGLGYAHSKGVVHRDIKPANIIITADKQAKITDFGIARVETSNLTIEGQLLGTPNYMAPEQIQGKEVDHRADLFSLGVMLYEILTGQKPFAANSLTAVTHRIVFEPFTPPEEIVPGLPPGITQVLNRALAKDPAQRYDRGQDMAADLRALFATPAVAGAPVAPRTGSFLVPDATPMKATLVNATLVNATPVNATLVPDATLVNAPPAALPDATVVTGVPSAGVPAAGVPVPAAVSPVAVSRAAVSRAAVSAKASAAAASAPTAVAEADETSFLSMPPAGRIAVAAAAALVVVLLVVSIGKIAFRGEDPPPPETPESARPMEEPPLVESSQEPSSPLLAPPAGVAPVVVPPASVPAASVPPPPVAVPVARATLDVDFFSEVSEGRLTIFNGQERLFQQAFEFVSGKSGVLRRSRKTSGSLKGRLTVDSGAVDLRIYVKPKDSSTRTLEVKGNLPPASTRILRIRVSEEGRLTAQLE